MKSRSLVWHSYITSERVVRTLPRFESITAARVPPQLLKYNTTTGIVLMQLLAMHAQAAYSDVFLHEEFKKSGFRKKKIIFRELRLPQNPDYPLPP
jgi:hypothetical protein